MVFQYWLSNVEVCTLYAPDSLHAALSFYTLVLRLCVSLLAKLTFPCFFLYNLRSCCVSIPQPMCFRHWSSVPPDSSESWLRRLLLWKPNGTSLLFGMVQSLSDTDFLFNLKTKHGCESFIFIFFGSHKISVIICTTWIIWYYVSLMCCLNCLLQVQLRRQPPAGHLKRRGGRVAPR